MYDSDVPYAGLCAASARDARVALFRAPRAGVAPIAELIAYEDVLLGEEADAGEARVAAGRVNSLDLEVGIAREVDEGRDVSDRVGVDDARLRAVVARAPARTSG